MGNKKFNIGDKVRYIGKDHKEMPVFYPKIGTVGTVVKEIGNTNWYIQWPKGSTSKKDRWYCDENDIELVKNEDMTNEEIWKMLKPKMEKNGLISNIYSRTKLDGFYLDEAYKSKDVHKAIAIAYRSGYERAMKGRSFKIGEKKTEEKKQGGRWVPVDPNNLPKEGTRVRYSRECKEYRGCNSEIVIGDTGVVKFEGLEHDWFGIKPDNRRSLYYNWLSFDDDSVGCLDMWVEDDE